MQMARGHTENLDPDSRKPKIDLRLRKPTGDDGVRIHDLIARCAPLDENSIYCNLLQCTHFADTSILAEHDGEIMGWVSGHLIPNDPECLFVWQVAVSSEARGQGLAGRMISALLDRPACRRVRRIQTTVTQDNISSRAMFYKLADELPAPLAEREEFESRRHFADRKPTEYLVDIGPFTRGDPGR